MTLDGILCQRMSVTDTRLGQLTNCTHTVDDSAVSSLATANTDGRVSFLLANTY